MANISFYPGPSRVYSNVTEYLIEGYKDGILSVNHRSDEFMTLSRKTKKLLLEKLDIPEDYKVLFISSATEGWEIISQSLATQSSQHFYNGAFGEKWSRYSTEIAEKTILQPFDLNEVLPADKVDQSVECICLVHTETSNGTYLSDAILAQVKAGASANQLIAIDCTSSIGGMRLPWHSADVWFASVQKCLGLPSGLGLMILSPKAIAKAEEVGETSHYNSLVKMLSNEEMHQTHYTPNILGIYLLNRTQKYSKGIDKIEGKVLNRYNYWSEIIKDFKDFSFLVNDEKLRARTVFAINYKKPEKLKHLASDAGFTLGNGYGKWSSSTFRIANFPAIKKREIEALSAFFRKRIS